MSSGYPEWAVHIHNGLWALTMDPGNSQWAPDTHEEGTLKSSFVKNTFIIEKLYFPLAPMLGLVTTGIFSIQYLYLILGASEACAYSLQPSNLIELCHKDLYSDLLGLPIGPHVTSATL